MVIRMSFKVTVAAVACCVVFGFRPADAAVAYTNLPPSQPFFDANMGSTVFGSAQDPGNMGASASLAMSFVPTLSGTISSLSLGLTFNAPGDGNVDIYLASDPMTAAGITTFTMETLLGTASATAAFGSTNSTLTIVSNPAPLSLLSGNTYYLVLVPSDSNTSIVWNANITGATSTYYTSSDLGATFTLGGVFDSDALQVDVTPVPEPATWIAGALLTGLISFSALRRRQARRASRTSETLR
jgi:hypothetical protein